MNEIRVNDALYQTVPAGLGSSGDIRLSMQEMDRLLVEGAKWVVRRGYGNIVHEIATDFRPMKSPHRVVWPSSQADCEC